MSRIGKKPVPVPSVVKLKVADRRITASGPKGSLEMAVPPLTQIQWDEGRREVHVAASDSSNQSRANHGLARALIANLVQGVAHGFERRLQIYGTGYNCKLQGRVLHLNVGYSGQRRGIGSQFEIPVPDGLEVVVEVPAARGDNDPAQFVIRGADRQKVGQFAAEIHALRKSEPYKGKGIRYEGEYIRRKQGKALTGAGGA
jgi:large subunit ribosomal protein L6